MTGEAAAGSRRPTILIVEDDDRIRRALELALIDEGYAVDEVADGESALGRLADATPDLLLVDLMLPGMSGFDLCRQVRSESDVPIIVVSARSDSHDVVAGLEAGADDYVTKPVMVKELAARIRALLRRARPRPPDEAPLRFADVEVRIQEGIVTKGGTVVNLTVTEFRLLCELATNPRRVLSRDQLLEAVWGYDYFGDGRIVDAHIRRLRTKVEEEPSEPRHVVTVRGLGYKFDPGEE